MWGVRSVDGDEEAALARVEALTGSKSSLGGDVPRLARARRRCTDRCCSVVLFAFLFGMWSVYQHALKEGNLAKLTRGFDWTGAICGVDEAVRDKPFLFWCTPNRNEAFTLLDGICVSQCPSSDREIFYCPGRALPFQAVAMAEGAGSGPVLR
ncbi:Choline transporter-like 2 [Durusdinium trenchii]|uniref:Choline transporter-like 2 n=1 Tax=Durusdinium trenchii TaxID=1381693 RepID=A0ABP0KC61_9DINO